MDASVGESEGLDHAEGRPRASWLRQVESYLKDTGMAGLASALAMARRRPKACRKVVAAYALRRRMPLYLT